MSVKVDSSIPHDSATQERFESSVIPLSVSNKSTKAKKNLQRPPNNLKWFPKFASPLKTKLDTFV